MSPPPDMTEKATPSEAREHAYQDWWAEYSRQWDPNRRLNKSRDAFVAGWNARATFLEAAGQVTPDRKIANVAGQLWVAAEDECETLRKMLRLATETLAALSPDHQSVALDEIIRDCRAALEAALGPRRDKNEG